MSSPVQVEVEKIQIGVEKSTKSLDAVLAQTAKKSADLVESLGASLHHFYKNNAELGPKIAAKEDVEQSRTLGRKQG